MEKLWLLCEDPFDGFKIACFDRLADASASGAIEFGIVHVGRNGFALMGGRYPSRWENGRGFERMGTRIIGSSLGERTKTDEAANDYQENGGESEKDGCPAIVESTA